MTKFEAVIFDYGNVLSAPQDVACIHRMAQKLGATIQRFEQAYWADRAPYDKGELDGFGYWANTAKRLGMAVSALDVEELIAMDNLSWSLENPSMARWAKSLRSSGTKTAILSNMPRDLFEFLPSGASWLPDFDHCTYSCLVKEIKPARAIYESCLAGLKVAAQRTLFIDDRQANIDAAAALGMQTLLFTSNADAESRLTVDFQATKEA